MQTNEAPHARPATEALDAKAYMQDLEARLLDTDADAGTLRETLAEAHGQRTIRRYWMKREISAAIRRLAHLTGRNLIEVRAQAIADGRIFRAQAE